MVAEGHEIRGSSSKASPSEGGKVEVVPAPRPHPLKIEPCEYHSAGVSLSLEEPQSGRQEQHKRPPWRKRRRRGSE